MLPEQVRKRAERANQLVAELNGEKPGEPTPAPAPNDPVDPQNPPAPAPTPEPTPAPSPAPVPAPAEDTWEHKYRTLQGVLAAETGRLQGQNKVLLDRVTALEQAATAPKPTPAAPAPSQQFSQDEIDRYGPELLNLIANKAQTIADEIVTRKVAEFTPQIKKVENDVRAVGQSVYENKEQEFWGELMKEVSDFHAVNQSHDFLVWLGQEDDISGVQRQAILDQAASRLDHKRVVKLFNAFKQAAGIPLPGATPSVSAPAPAAPQPPVSPSPRTVGTGGSGPTPREPQAPTVKRSEIAAHYRRSSSDPTYRTLPEYQAMEQRIFQAQAANRVVDA